MADAEGAYGPEWDSVDSGRYQVGREQAEADHAAGRYDDRAGVAPRPWTEGYRDWHEEAGILPAGSAPGSTPGFPACEQCPTREACGVAEFCVTESRFGRADLTIGELACGQCGRGSESAWPCTEGGECEARSALWGQWFLVRLYANDARSARVLPEDAGR